MKIYQIHCCGGVWEDAYDYIQESYLDKDRAEQRRKELSGEIEEIKKAAKICDNCPLYNENNENCSKSEMIDLCQKHCGKLEFVELKEKENEMYMERGDYDCIYCANATFTFDDEYFKVEEVDVIE